MANKITLTGDDLREDQVTAAEIPAPAWETVSFPEAGAKRPTVPTVGADGQVRERELTDYEMRKVEESKDNVEAMRQASAATRGSNTLDAQMKARRVVQPLDENKIYSFAPSASIHEERVLMLTTGEDDEVRGYLTDATGFLQSTRETLTKIDTAYRDLMLDRTLTPDARSAKLEKATSDAYQKAYVGHAKAVDALTRKIAFTEGELSKPLEAQAATQRSVELRAVVRELKADKRNELIRTAIHADAPSAAQRELLQCVLGSHHLTCGLSEIEQTLHVKTYNTRTQSGLTRRLDLMRKSLDILSSIKPATLVSQYEGAMRSKFTRATAISGISSKAAASLAAINGG